MSNESSSEKAQVPLLPETYHVLILQAGRIYTERMVSCELRFESSSEKALVPLLPETYFLLILKQVDCTQSE